MWIGILGFPIKHPGSSSYDFNFILERVKQKLVGWKANMLSLVGRTVLIQASSAAIPSYIMQCNKFLGESWMGLTGLIEISYRVPRKLQGKYIGLDGKK